MLMFSIKIGNKYLNDFEEVVKSSGYPGNSQNLGIGTWVKFKPILLEEKTLYTSRAIGDKIKTLAQCMKDNTINPINIEIITTNQ